MAETEVARGRQAHDYLAWAREQLLVLHRRVEAMDTEAPPEGSGPEAWTAWAETVKAKTQGSLGVVKAMADNIKAMASVASELRQARASDFAEDPAFREFWGKLKLILREHPEALAAVLKAYDDDVATA